MAGIVAQMIHESNAYRILEVTQLHLVFFLGIYAELETTMQLFSFSGGECTLYMSPPPSLAHPLPLLELSLPIVMIDFLTAISIYLDLLKLIQNKQNDLLESTYLCYGNMYMYTEI